MRSRKQKLIYIFALIIGIASLSIGFAAFSTTLNISSNASVNPNSDSFKVKFSTSPDSLIEGPVVSDDAGGIEHPTVSDAIINNTLYPTISNIAVTFTHWGYASYTFYARNEGEYTAYLNAINFNGKKVCKALGDTTKSLVEQACDDINISVTVGDNANIRETTDISNAVLEKDESVYINIWISYSYAGDMSDGPFTVTFPEISLIYSTIDQPGYTPSIMGADDATGTLNSKIKADPLFKGTDANVDFSATPETGVYVRSGTENNTNPIYYYRGAVTNNNVLFANKCWKIVRTTEAGGVKLIYNGEPIANECLGTTSTIGNSAFNDTYNSIEDVSYIYSDGTNSTIKQTIDTWYTSNMTSYTEFLEDTVWCNDRRVVFSGYRKELGYDVTYFAGESRNAENVQPLLQCPAEYSLTTSATQASNKLTYPVALLTADELTLAGMGVHGYSEDNYLNNSSWWWTMTPFGSEDNTMCMFIGDFYGGLNSPYVYYQNGVRPAISLKAGTMVARGNGTSATPYIIE